MTRGVDYSTVSSQHRVLVSITSYSRQNLTWSTLGSCHARSIFDGGVGMVGGHL
jgi:hypothetical protein